MEILNTVEVQWILVIENIDLWYYTLGMGLSRWSNLLIGLLKLPDITPCKFQWLVKWVLVSLLCPRGVGPGPNTIKVDVRCQISSVITIYCIKSWQKA